MTTKRRFKVDKLVRDTTPEFLAAKQISLFSRIMDREEFIKSLKDKLKEEAHEVAAVKNQHDLKDELGDMLEVFHALVGACGLTFGEVEDTQVNKKIAKGGFEKRIYGEFIEMDSDNKKIDYYLKQPEKYPEIK